MKLGLRVTFSEGEQKNITARFSDFVAFERTWNRSVARFENELRLTDLAWLAWHAETRLNQTKLKFDPDWIAGVEEVEVAEAERDNPLATTPQVGS